MECLQDENMNGHRLAEENLALKRENNKLMVKIKIFTQRLENLVEELRSETGFDVTPRIFSGQFFKVKTCGFFTPIILIISVESVPMFNKNIHRNTKENRPVTLDPRSTTSTKISLRNSPPQLADIPSISQDIRIHDVYHINLQCNGNAPDENSRNPPIIDDSSGNTTGSIAPIQIIKCEPEFMMDEPDPIEGPWACQPDQTEQDNWEKEHEELVQEQEEWTVDEEQDLSDQRQIRGMKRAASGVKVRIKPVKDEDWKKEQNTKRNRKRRAKKKKMSSLDNKIVRCKVCRQIFPNTLERRKHTKSQHYNVQLDCDQCDFSTFYRNILLNHTETVHLGIIHTCDICGATFGYQSAMKQHRRVRHEKIPYPCNECGRLFNNPSALRKHKKDH